MGGRSLFRRSHSRRSGVRAFADAYKTRPVLAPRGKHGRLANYLSRDVRRSCCARENPRRGDERNIQNPNRVGLRSRRRRRGDTFRRNRRAHGILCRRAVAQRRSSAQRRRSVRHLLRSDSLGQVFWDEQKGSQVTRHRGRVRGVR